ncbi:P-loop containing nucleoside triphosphate hydrolase protein [Fimicolochytrium jonesii]|uniref:P-loop containing nucleoside triphosphate hydrolase protein n=1 Tax=Fimicolochytrium jonesii TaxID=1396493 RepID=UPI0022FE4D2C|nr:P-loop containing nucleoside triphosphate hydrolase protein [Fimicolochytrium jonesii]KAI8822433.1 P-loop containing nucleoside triphosphate hydrolase protein [Fimicolochytrium jonesii]
MGKLRPRYNEKARAGSRLAKTAKPHPSARDGGLKSLAKKTSTTNAKPSNGSGTSNKAAHSAAATAGDEDDITYTASSSANPTMLIPGESAPTDYSALPEAPTGKITSKKKKRLEKFIEKQLKKEERVSLLKKLSEQTFDASEFLRSSKAFGQTKLTAKEKLRQALLEERKGIARSDNAVRLLVEREVDEENADGMEMSEGEGEDHDGDEDADIENEIEEDPSIGIVGRAFGSSLTTSSAKPKAPVVQVFEESASASKADAAAAPQAFGSALKPSAFGGALKRKAADGAEGEFTEIAIPKRKKKKQQKKKAEVPANMYGSDSDDSHSDGQRDGVAEAVADTEAVPPQADQKKAIWAANIVDGETLPQPIVSSSAPTHLKGDTKQPPKPKPTAPSKPAFHVPVARPESIQLARISLPVVMEEQPIMDAITNNDVTILCGETGSGKTTQVPQFLYEAGFGDPAHPMFPGMVGITQPRRVAAVSMARRVADEMALKGGEVAYQIRYDKGNTGKNTRIKFMTDGILLRELSLAAGGEQSKSATSGTQRPADLLLSHYSCIIIDEAHERTVGTDVLIGWLTRIVALRNSGKIEGAKPLKLVIMSATLRVEDFTLNKTLFPTNEKKPPVVKVDGRQHKVVIHYNKVTPELDYSSEAFKKITKIHTKLPPGGILVFMTGQQEIQVLVRKLRKEFPMKQANELEPNEIEDAALKPVATAEGESGAGSLFEEGDESADVEMGRGQDDYQSDSDAEGANDEDDEEEHVDVLGGLSGDEDDEATELNNRQDPKTATEPLPLHVLPLYSLLPTAAQMRVFSSPPPNTRLVVIATNVAETSLTIPGIKYVVDCGKVKERRYDTHSGAQTYQVCWTSRASADQRAGRAGRTGPGHCYRLFSSAVFNDYFDQFSQPEILRVPIEGVVLQMKSMGINNVVGFPFPTPPGRDNLRAAEKLLTYLGALDSETQVLKITELGKVMAKFPVAPRYAKMLVIAASQPGNILAYVVALVAGLSVGDPFLKDEDILGNTADADDGGDGDGDGDEEDGEKSRRSKKRASFYKTMALFSGDPPTSDALRLLRAIGAHAAQSTRADASLQAFCDSHFLRHKAMDEMRKLRQQLTILVKLSLGNDGKLYPAVSELCVDPRLPPPTPRDCAAILQVVLSAFSDRIARLDEATSRGFNGAKFTPLYRTMWGAKDEVCQIHPGSCLYRERPAPVYVVFEELMGREEKISADNSGVVANRGGLTVPVDKEGTPYVRRWMKGVTAVKDTWIANVAPKTLCRLGKIMEQPEPRYDIPQDAVVGFCVPTLGPKMWELPARECVLPRVEDRSRWFARAFVEGKVPLMPLATPATATNAKQRKRAKAKKGKEVEEEILPMLTPYLLTKPLTLTKAWGATHAKSQALLTPLLTNAISTRAALLHHWRTVDSKFLLEGYLHWVPDEVHAGLSAYWPPARLWGEDEEGGERDDVRVGEMRRCLGEVLGKGMAGKRERWDQRGESGSDSDF